jgi:hypothetical protein
MDSIEFVELVKEIVNKARILKDSHTQETEAKVSYAAIFSQSANEYEELIGTAMRLGKVIDNTPTGPLFLVDPIKTDAGTIKIIKIRKPDASRRELGDADFNVSDYQSFKDRCLQQPGFKLIVRPKFEMIELAAKESDVLAYFSNPPVDKQYHI